MVSDQTGSRPLTLSKRIRKCHTETLSQCVSQFSPLWCARYVIHLLLHTVLSLQTISPYNVFEQGLITVLLWQLRASHHLTLQQGFGNDTTKQILNAILDYGLYGLYGLTTQVLNLNNNN